MKVRPLLPGDDETVGGIFRATLFLGGELEQPPPDIDRFERFCLGWYLGPGRPDAAVVEGIDGAVVGYALVCTDPAGHRRWTRGAALRFAAGTAGRLALGCYPADAARFYRLRFRDGWELWRHAPALGGLGHAHINLLPAARAADAGRLLGAHVDARVAAVGMPAWFGEINALEGTRARAIERLGGTVVHRAPNHTLTALLGRRVERLTVVRRLDAARHRHAA